jgi:uncharacterized RDD family membrane protein YckC
MLISPIPQNQNRIGLLPRLGAFFIDLVLVSIIFNLIGVTDRITARMNLPEAGNLSLVETMKALFADTGLAVSIFAFYLFYWMLEAIIAATPGKMLLGLQIAEENGTEAPSGLLWRRYLMKHSHHFAMLLALLLKQDIFLELSNILFMVLFGSYLVLAARRQTLYDVLAKTAVFKKAVIKAEEPLRPQESHQE